MAENGIFHQLLKFNDKDEPKLQRTCELTMVGDWGGANFHRICSWLTQEFCDRTAPGSRTSIRSLRDGGMDAILQVAEGEADLAIATPAGLLERSLTGAPPFPYPMQHLRALATLPQNDRMVFAINPKYGIEDFKSLRLRKPAIRLATSINDGTNFIGYVADRFLEAHGISEHTIKSWGGSVIRAHRPEQCVALVEEGKADALLQEAIMTSWWRGLIDSQELHPFHAESSALESLNDALGLGTNVLPKGFWDSLGEDLPALDFSDFVVGANIFNFTRQQLTVSTGCRKRRHAIGSRISACVVSRGDSKSDRGTVSTPSAGQKSFDIPSSTREDG
jgi:hypothetical protein